MKKIKSFLFLGLVATIIAGCGAGASKDDKSPKDEKEVVEEVEKNPKDEVVEGEDSEEVLAEETEKANATAGRNNDWEIDVYRQAGFEKAPQFEYIGIGYFQDHNGDFRDAYIPYGGSLNVDPNHIQGYNHGVGVSVYMTDGQSASSVLEDEMSLMISQGGEAFQNLQFGQPQSFNNDTVAAVLFVYSTAVGEELAQVYSILYTDIKEGGYLVAMLYFLEQEYDDKTESLIQELELCYGLTIPRTY